MAVNASANIALALWYRGPGQVELREEAIAPPGADEVRVKTLYSAISRGTESLVFNGRIPVGEFERMRAPYMAGDFAFPVMQWQAKYEGVYLLGTSIARPLISKVCLQVAREVGAAQ